MKYMSRFEMKAIERGRREGLLEGLQLGLELRFGKPGLEQMEELSRIDSLETLMRVKDALTTVASPAELRRIYAL